MTAHAITSETEGDYVIETVADEHMTNPHAHEALDEDAAADIDRVPTPGFARIVILTAAVGFGVLMGFVCGVYVATH